MDFRPRRQEAPCASATNVSTRAEVAYLLTCFKQTYLTTFLMAVMMWTNGITLILSVLVTWLSLICEIWHGLSHIISA